MCIGAYKHTSKLNVNNDQALCNRLEFFEQFYYCVYQNTNRYSFEPLLSVYEHIFFPEFHLEYESSGKHVLSDFPESDLLWLKNKERTQTRKTKNKKRNVCMLVKTTVK